MVAAAVTFLVTGELRALGGVALALVGLSLLACRRRTEVACFQWTLSVDSLVAVGLWWLYGPAAGVSFVLFYVVAAAGLLLPRPQAVAVGAAALAAQLVQAPLHFWAKQTSLPLFHPPSAVSDGEFLAGVAVGLGAIVVTGFLFGVISEMLDTSRHALADTERKFQRIFDQSAEAIFIFDPDTDEFLDVNQRATDLLGYTRDELLALSPTVLHADEVDAFRRFVARVRAEGRAWTAELSCAARSGVCIPCEVSASTIELDGRLWVVASVFDVSERQRAQRALRESEERYRSLVEGSPDPIAIHIDGRFSYANQATAGLLGLEDPEQLVGRSVLEFLHPEERDDATDRIRRVASQENVEVVQTRLMRADGTVAEVEISAIPTTHHDQPAIQVVARDITEQRITQRRLEELVRSKDEFIASVSHELRTPITAVVGFAQELRAGLDSFNAEEGAEMLKLITEQSMEVANLVEDLLVAARADIGALAVRPEPVRLDRELAAVLELCTTCYPDAQARIDTHAQGDEQVWADPARLRQILRNLVTNALRYGGPHIEVRVQSPTPDATTIQVRDDGPGVPPGEEDAIFDPYHRATQETSQPGSVGLGLYVSRHLADLMDGDLTYRREHDITIFELNLPAASPASINYPQAS